MARIANDPLENDRANNNNKKIKSNKNKPWNDEINNEQKTSSVERNTRKITRWKASERWIDQLLGASGLHPQCIRLASGQWNPYVGARPFLYFIYSFNFFLFCFLEGGGSEEAGNIVGLKRRFHFIGLRIFGALNSLTWTYLGIGGRSWQDSRALGSLEARHRPPTGDWLIKLCWMSEMSQR